MSANAFRYRIASHMFSLALGYQCEISSLEPLISESTKEKKVWSTLRFSRVVDYVNERRIGWSCLRVGTGSGCGHRRRKFLSRRHTSTPHITCKQFFPFRHMIMNSQAPTQSSDTQRRAILHHFIGHLVSFNDNSASSSAADSHLRSSSALGQPSKVTISEWIWSCRDFFVA